MYIRTNPVLKHIFKPIIYFCEWYGAKFPVSFVKLRYYVRFHRRLDLKHPQTLNEKILYLSLCTDTTLWTLCADKYRVREHIESIGLGDHLVKLYGHWDDVNQCKFEELPNRFVLKCNHGSGDVAIIKGKSSVDEMRLKDRFRKELSKPYGALEGGLHYMRITPCLLAEELLDIASQDIQTSSLIDYKIWCVNGKPQFIWTCYNRSDTGIENMLFDVEWNDCSHYLVYNSHYQKPTVRLPKPKCLDQLLLVAEKIAQGIPILRCDLYIVNDKVYFGEMTFTSNGGMMFNYTDEFQYIMGRKIVI